MVLNGRVRQFPVADVAAWLVLAAIVAAFLVIQVRIHRGVYGESDSRAYLMLAKRLATGGPIAVADPDPFLHHDHGWVETAQGKLVPKFPPGYPVLLLPFYWVAGDDGMLWGSPVFGALALIGAFVLFRSWMSRVAALAATALLAVDSFVVFFSCYVLPHAADLCVVVWAMACLWRWMRGGCVGWGIGAGLLLGFAVLVRPANALLGLPFAVVWCQLAWVRWGRCLMPGKAGLLRDLAWVAGAYLFMLAILLVYQTIVFGSPLTSGYDLAGERHSIAWSFLGQRFPKYLDVLVRFLGVPFVVGSMGLFLFGSGVDRLLRLLWAGLLLLLHSCYYWDAHWFHWLLRFLLATFPVFYGAMFGWIDSASGRWGKCAVMAFLVALPFLPVPRANRGAFDIVANLRNPPQNSRVVRARVEAAVHADAVIFADEAGRDALDSRKRFRVYSLNAFRTLAAAVQPPQQADREPRMQASRRDRIEAFYRKHTPAELCEMKRKKVAEFLSQGRQVVLLLDPKALERERAELAPEIELRTLGPEGVTSLAPWVLYEAKRGETREAAEPRTIDQETAER